MFLQINYLAVAVVVVAHQILGAFYYGLLAKPWMTALGVTNKELDGKDPVPYIVALAGSLVFTLGIAVLADRLAISTAASGALLGLAVAGAFSLSFLATHYAFGGSVVFSSHWTLFLIDSGRDILAGVIAGAILAVWR